MDMSLNGPWKQTNQKSEIHVPPLLEVPYQRFLSECVLSQNAWRSAGRFGRVPQEGIKARVDEGYKGAVPARNGCGSPPSFNS